MSLQRQFSEAGLDLKAADEPFGRNERIFGLDINGDHFRAWVPDHVQASVQAKDPKMRQVVLTVREPEASFQVEIEKYMMQRDDKLIRTIGPVRSGREGRTKVLVERKTPSETRHFLCGVDERNHPFIAQLPGAATSIRAAHELLKPPELRDMRVKGHGKNYKSKKGNGTATRQGEWFFVKASEEEVAKIEEVVAKSGSKKRVSLGGRGKPHTVDERVELRAWEGKHGRRWEAAVYCRGKVKHVEHDTLDFPYWMRVYRNLEAGGATAGATWVD
jgi:hypothetical protein